MKPPFPAALPSSDSCASVDGRCSSRWEPVQSSLYARRSEIAPAHLLLWVYPHLLSWVLGGGLAPVFWFGEIFF